MGSNYIARFHSSWPLRALFTRQATFTPSHTFIQYFLVYTPHYYCGANLKLFKVQPLHQWNCENSISKFKFHLYELIHHGCQTGVARSIQFLKKLSNSRIHRIERHLCKSNKDQKSLRSLKKTELLESLLLTSGPAQIWLILLSVSVPRERMGANVITVQCDPSSDEVYPAFYSVKSLNVHDQWLCMCFACLKRRI